MPKYYYTDPLKAAWQIKNHAFKLESIVSWEAIFEVACDCQGGGGFRNEWFDDKYYIHPNCHELLKPQVDDIIEFDGFVYGLVNSVNADEIAIQCDDIFYVRDIEECTIIQRNEKAFFMPEVKNE